jgi:hypothetical protein
MALQAKLAELHRDDQTELPADLTGIPKYRGFRREKRKAKK